ncbi:ephrin-A3-like [Scleropages formosus]|uniref:Ephrin-A3-like n=1 Tax=Scleropages formosus TaxID=113540 RepID=A0A0P7UQR1_SCLFO|nr:ephrin-A3-like [Scleropages formosus]
MRVPCPPREWLIAVGVMEYRICLQKEDYTVQVSVNDYLDIYCPLYNGSHHGGTSNEQYVLYMVSYRGYRTCDPKWGFKRWECSKPHAPNAPNVPIKFSEKFQRYSAFSLGYEFNVGHEYYYISSHADDDSNPAVPDYTVRPNIKIHSIEEFSPEVPRLEKSTSGSSPSHDRLLLTVATFFLATLSVS